MSRFVRGPVKDIVSSAEEQLYSADPISESARELISAMQQLRAAQQRQEARSLDQSGLHSQDLRALRYIVQADRNGQPISPKDLISMLKTSSANVTNVIDRLVKKSLVTRDPHPTDRRARYLKPTGVAINEVDAAFEEHHAALIAVANEVSAEDAETTIHVLRQLATALDRVG
ncbi:MarR family winged helix-turn-helix transcriptional regulator [Leucobacter sp. USHLN153]|uniref:MarR family winged helix-turn-helix transcriptional regulator n=1 Tax=Leucobacter sp. USHLN153 TaxID=3081268 RepID=UPI00301B0E0C